MTRRLRATASDDSGSAQQSKQREAPPLPPGLLLVAADIDADYPQPVARRLGEKDLGCRVRCRGSRSSADAPT
jgi:hypothetical protein